MGVIHRLRWKNIFTALTVGAGSIMLITSLVFTPAASAISIGGPSDCGGNAMIHCGAHSSEALTNAYNSRAYVRGVYAEFGITQGDIANLPSTNVAGRVTKDGNIFVDGQSNAVATNAVTGGRQNIPGSTKVNHQGAIFYRRPPSVSFQQASLPAFVSMQNGQFQFAVIASCGNAVSAQPVSPPHHAVAPAKAVSKPEQKPQPKPQPKPQQPAPAQPAPAPTPQVNVNNTNTNVNNNVNTQTQVVTQKQVSWQPAPAPTPAQPQSTETVATAQPSSAAPAQATASTLPNTGPTGVVGAFLLSVGLGTWAYRWLLLRRLNA